MLGCLPAIGELQRNPLTQKHLPPQVYIATLTHDNQIKPVNFAVTHETVFPSQKDNCHQVSTGSGNGYFSIRFIDEGEKINMTHQDSISFGAVKPFRSQCIKRIWKNYKMLLQHSVILKDADITDNKDLIAKTIPQDDIPFHPDLSTKNGKQS